MSFNQVVAFNLEAHRRAQRWTQARLGKELERFLGVRWSKASVSAAERSTEGKRIKKFDADEIAAIAKALSIPAWQLLLPPPTLRGLPVRVRASGPGWGEGLNSVQWLDLVMPPIRSPREEAFAITVLQAIAPFMTKVRSEEPMSVGQEMRVADEIQDASEDPVRLSAADRLIAQNQKSISAKQSVRGSRTRRIRRKR